MPPCPDLVKELVHGRCRASKDIILVYRTKCQPRKPENSTMRIYFEEDGKDMMVDVMEY